MAKIHLDFLVLETFDRLFGVTAFLEVVDKAIPETEWREQEALKQLAEGEHWDYADYAGQRQVLDQKFRHWLPRYAGYSVVILLHSVVETQLFNYAQRVGSIRSSPFRVKDIK